MNIVRQNPTLAAAVALSVLLHGGLLAVRIIDPDAFKYKPTNRDLEVILVNAKQDKKPVNSEILAQADLDGGGNAEDGRARSPLPDLHRTDDGDDIKVARQRVAELEEEQAKMLAELSKNQTLPISQDTAHEKPKQVKPDGDDKTDSDKAFTRSAVEIAKDVSEYNKRPKKIQVTPSTKQVEYAQYYSIVRARIEKVGTLNFPQQNGKKLYGSLTVSIQILPDGRIYEDEGGPKVERSSGNKALDAAALHIVRQSAPFEGFRGKSRPKNKNFMMEMVTKFIFSREEGIKTELREAGQ